MKRFISSKLIYYGFILMPESILKQKLANLLIENIEHL